MASGDSILLEMSGIQKSFPGVCAIEDGQLQVRRGEVHALMGENGAGKSTLIKILAGAYRADAGAIRLDGSEVRICSPHEGRKLGIAVIYQEFSLVPTLSVRENLFLGQEHSRMGWLVNSSERSAAAELFQRLGYNADLETPCRLLSVAEQQLVEIAKALYQRARIIVMDEPTAALSDREADRLFEIVCDLRSQGMAIIYVSHRLDEVFALCDRVTVMRDGKYIGTDKIGNVSRERLIELMVGRKLEAEFPKRASRIGATRLSVLNLRRGKAVRGVSLEVRSGEVVCLAGLVGAGRTETVRMLFGADAAEQGSIVLDNRKLTIRSPRDAIHNGICLLTEDRKRQGLVLGLPVRDNFGLPNLEFLSRFGFVRRRAEREAFAGFIRDLRIKIPHQEQLAGNLSGGNQQKVVLAKWLQANSEVVIFDEPTRGVDVGAKFEIYQLINDLAATGKAVLMVSSDLPEVLGMSDRIIVMREGRITGEITDVARCTQEDILRLATN